MKGILKFIILVSVFFGNAQKKPKGIYFPQEQILLDACLSSIDKNECFNQRIKHDALMVLDEIFTKDTATKDTLKIKIEFKLNKKAEITKEKLKVSLNKKELNPMFSLKLSSILVDYHSFEVINKKSKKYNTTHSFSYSYLISDGTFREITFNSVDTYTGGNIKEIPLFPVCERKDEYYDKKCFQESMQKHIVNNFRYPIEAQKNKIQGVVSIEFIINTDGEKEKITTKGPSPILEKEARRIINLLPKFKPALVNGKPTKMPYSIPITFKLR